MAAPWRAVEIVVRVLMVVGGGYAVAAGFAALLPVTMVAARLMVRSEAAILSSMMAFVVYLAVILWAVAEPSLPRLAAKLAAAGAAFWGGAYGLARLTVPT